MLAIGGVWCVWAWADRHGPRTAATLGGVGLAMFLASHLLALVIGAWPAVLASSGVLALVTWCYADVPWSTSPGAGSIGPL